MLLSKEYPYIYLNYSELCELRKSYRHYEEIFENLFEVKEISEVFNGLNFLSKETKEKLLRFQEKWYEFIEANNYSSDPVFVYLDTQFQHILDNELKSFLLSFNLDMQKNNFVDIESLEYTTREFPDSKAILERGCTLYGLLIKHKVIKKD